MTDLDHRFDTPWPEPPEDNLEPPPPDLDAEERAFDAATRHNIKVASRLDALRVERDARAKLRAEEAAEVDFADLYLTRNQLDELPAPDPLIDRVMPRHAYGILRGRDHSLKSFTAVDWACCLATGKRWHDHPVAQVPVLYIAGEGAHGIAARIDAWEYAWQRPVPDHMLVTRKTGLNLHAPGAAFDELLDHVHTHGYGLVVVDTLRRVSGTADGNSSEMGAVIDNLDRIKRATTDGTVLAVAHTDKGDHDTRGYSGIEDDADFVWSAKRDDDRLTLELTKMKDGPDGRTIHLTATRTLQSLTLSGAGPAATTDTVSTDSQLAVLNALRTMPHGGATASELRSLADLAKTSYYRAVSELLRHGHIVNTGSKQRPYYELPPTLDVLADGLDTPPTDPADSTSADHTDTPIEEDQ